MNYFQNMQYELCKFGLSGNTQKNNQAWENKKAKAVRKITPRGKAFTRMDALHKNIWRVL